MAGLIALFLVILMAAAPNAFAAFEEVKSFGQSGEGVQLSSASGIAINEAGAGGVTAGTVYAVTERGRRVVRYEPDGEFREAWGWGAAAPGEGSFNEFQRCGPSGDPKFLHCRTLDSGVGGEGSLGEGAGQFITPAGIAVNPSNGFVYVLDRSRKKGVVQVFNADGSQLIASFGERGVAEETISEGPGKIHAPQVGGIAVDGNGTVYLADRAIHNDGRPEETRIMVFKPQSPGAFEHYVYAGLPADIASSTSTVNYIPVALSLDSLGHLYTAYAERIFEFSLVSPASPICEYIVPSGGLSALAAATDGRIFYYDFKKKGVFELSACDSEGNFNPVNTTPYQATLASQRSAGVEGIAFNSSLVWEPERSAGVLYAADGEEVKYNGLGDIFAPTVAHTPLIASQYVSDLSASTAMLNAQISPNGSQTRYHFEYLTEAAYLENEPADRFAGAAEAPLGGALLGSGQAGQAALSAKATVSGLSPGTRYRFRVAAENASGTVVGGEPDPGFSTFPLEPGGLPDGRAYELVTPPVRTGEIYPPLGGSNNLVPGFDKAKMPMQARADGDAVAYEGQPFGAGTAAGPNQYLASRGATWETRSLSSSLSGESGGQGFKAFAPDLSRAVLYQVEPSFGAAPANYANLYLWTDGMMGSPQPLIETAPPTRTPGTTGGNQFKITFGEANAGGTPVPALDHIVFQANDALTAVTADAPAAPPVGFQEADVYEWTNGQLQLVNVLPGNEAAAPNAVLGAGLQLKTLSSKQNLAVDRAISADGSRIFWTDLTSGKLYVRESGEQTLEVPGPGTCKSSVELAQRACFLTASSDGGKVLLSNGSLYDVSNLGEPPIDLTGGEGGFKGILGTAGDLSRIYFVDTGALTPPGEENANGEHAEASKPNLYLWEQSGVSFIARFSTRTLEGDSQDWNASPSSRTAQVSPDGRFAAFVSEASLTGYDNTPLGGEPVDEVFEYDAAAGTLSCPSCNPTGSAPLGRSRLTLIDEGEGSGALPQPFNLVPEGEGELFFESNDVLSSHDVNGHIQDVYGWRPQGSAGCSVPAGCIGLISSGTSGSDSYFMNTTPSGSDVFIVTRQRLLPTDGNDFLDLYDARKGGGITAPPAPPPCTGEACRGPISPAPGLQESLGSESSFPTKAPAKTCKKGYVKKKGKCVKKPHKKQGKHRGKRGSQRADGKPRSGGGSR